MIASGKQQVHQELGRTNVRTRPCTECEAGGVRECGIGSALSDWGNGMNSKQELLARLRRIISEQLVIQQDGITERSTWTQLGADSLDRLGITIAIEDAFAVDIPHKIGERFNTVGETLDYLLAAYQSVTIRRTTPH